MIQNFRRILVILVVSVCTANVDGQQNSSIDLRDETKEKIDRLVSKLVSEKGVPGISIAVGINNQPSYAKGFGQSDVENSVDTTTETRFRTASIAKSLTSVAVLSLVEEGKIDLDAEVQQYCPNYPKKRWPVTVRQVLGHLGGVRHYKSSGEASSTEHFFSLDAGLATFAEDPLLHEPGTKFRYSSFGYNLLGSVAEGAGGQEFFSLLSERVLKPSGMTHTVTDDTFAVIQGRAKGYVRHNGRSLYRFPKRHNLIAGELYNSKLHDTSMKIPGGGLLSTPTDLIRFACAVNRQLLLPEKRVEQMWTAQKTTSGRETGYGLGWKVGKQLDRRAVWHTGGQSGTSTVLLLFPESGTSVAVMCNLQSLGLTGLASSIANEIIEAQQADAVTESTRQEVVEKLKSAVQYEVEQKHLPAFSISIVEGNDVIWADGFGFQDAEKEIPATASTVYRVGSISKLLTDISVMKLVESGDLDMDEPVTTYLPDFKPNNTTGKPITLRQLMTHRSGLVRESPVGNYFDPSQPTLAATVASLNGTPIIYEPETRTKYSNAAIAVVGAILEKKLSGRHADLVKQEIFDPLEMNDSSFELTPEIEKKLATAYMWTYDDRRFEAPKFLLGTGPAGNLYSSVVDLSKFVSFIFNDGKAGSRQVIKPETLKMMTSAQKDAHGNPQDFGIGFHVGNLDGNKTIGHGGAVYGFSTQLEALPDRKLGVVAASALDGSNGVAKRLSNYALRLMIAHQDQQPLPEYLRTGSIPVKRARELAGHYQETDGNHFARITELNGKSYLQAGTFRYQLRAGTKDGTIMTDDPIGFGVKLMHPDASTLLVGDKKFERTGHRPPADIPDHWKGLIGEYGWDHNTLYILEDGGQLFALIEWFYYYPLTEVNENEFKFPDFGMYHGEGLTFTRDSNGFASHVVAAEVKFARREVGTKDGETFKITPVKPIDDLRESALAASPPPEPGDYRQANLVDVTKLDRTIKLDIRYATTNNFTGAVFYKQPKAFMQRPAAEAVVRANARLKKRGLGLLIHDAYRPWHVTKMFWDATPSEMKDFVANPANGSRHNRGCAVDITLYDLKTGKPIQMVAGYDEFSPRSFPMYPGGTSRQRWYRTLLRETMESEDFSVYEFEWWHFDYQDWKKYRIGNVTFEEILNESK